jgi:hypothetical protein
MIARGLVPGTLNMEQAIVKYLQEGMDDEVIAAKLQIPLCLVTGIRREHYESHE